MFRKWTSQTYLIMVRVDTAMALLSGAIFLAAAIFIVVDVLGRNYTGLYSGATDELSGYALAIGTTWGMAFALRRKGHVAIDALTAHLPRRAQSLSEAIALVMMGLFGAILAWFMFGLAFRSYLTGVVSIGIIGTPLFVPQGMMAIGFSVLAVEALVLLLTKTAVSEDGRTGGERSECLS